MALGERLKKDASALPTWFKPPEVAVVMPAEQPSTVFLSGATGFYGAFLLESLVKESKVAQVRTSPHLGAARTTRVFETIALLLFDSGCCECCWTPARLLLEFEIQVQIC